ncbi:MAG TPA: nuclear transport factor 2 family protein [Marmoricola sp.]|nr:nuclear transport factor 2 family protein [Marmoricola sp.]
MTAEVLAAANHLIDTFGRHDPEAYFATFAEDATFIFYNHPDRLESRQAWRDLWAEWEGEGFRVLGCRSTHQLVQALAEDTAVFSHWVETEAKFGDEVNTTFERETIVFRRLDGAWLAVHEHLSPMTN